MDDDLRRRGVAPGEAPVLAAVAKCVPFLGLCAYGAARPALPSRAAGPAVAIAFPEE